MGVDSTDAYGKPAFNDRFALPGDIAAAVAFADAFANVRAGTSAERQALPAGKQRPGMLFTETDRTGPATVHRTDGAGGWTQLMGMFAVAAGRHGGGTGFVTVNFPAGRFTQPPVVLCQVESGAGNAAGTAIRVNAVTKDGFTYATTVVSVPIMWAAVQMTGASAAG